MKHTYIWFVITAIMGTCAIGLAVNPDGSSNHPALSPAGSSNYPAVFPHTDDPSPLGNTNQTSRTSTNATLPLMYQGTISNLHDVIGTNAVNHSNDNPDPRPPHTPPQ